MEFICRFHDADELARVRQLLRSKGIPTHVMNAESRRLGEQWAMYACLGEQAEDARRVIRDPQHEPALQVNPVDFERAMASGDDKLLVRWSTIILVAVARAFVVLAYLFQDTWSAPMAASTETSALSNESRSAYGSKSGIPR